MTGALPHTAMVLAAGLGSRLGDGPPKPLRRVGGRALIDRALDMLGEAGVARIVVNTHHRAAGNRGPSRRTDSSRTS